MAQDYTIAVVGATGVIGREMIGILAERRFPVKQLHALASERSAGERLTYGRTGSVSVGVLKDYDFRDCDIVLASAGGAVAAAMAERATEHGAILIDNSSHFRMDEDVPLVIPEVNAEALASYERKRMIANPNCSTIQMLVALKPLHDMWRIRDIVVATYQSTSGAGREAMDELWEQNCALFNNKEIVCEAFPRQIAFNTIPSIDIFLDDGACREEWKMCVETRKILGDDSIGVLASCVRVPTLIGHGEAVHVTFEEKVDVHKARVALAQADGVTVVDDAQETGRSFITPLECVGDDDVYVSRLRGDPHHSRRLALWVVADNVRKGGALNAVQIAEHMIRDYL
ncbi:MAG: aspartate-semialdehyde dehydrogenase [Alphaproteobacteria bacterium GM7ARS4]|nr:aspartate-semialdehyde dehydrogenase [Alphaproteobacteria bacterium GM7ARS4]